MLLRNCAEIGNGMIVKRSLAKILEARVVDTVKGPLLEISPKILSSAEPARDLPMM